MPQRRVLIVGGGVAGMSTALDLARHGVAVDLVEKSPFLGGHAAGYTCKATDACAGCGACQADARIEAVHRHKGIRTLCGARIESVGRDGRFSVHLAMPPPFIDPQRCTGCGLCVAVCPQPGAMTAAPSAVNRPPVAVDPDRCRNTGGRDCRRCAEACPERAIDLSQRPVEMQCRADAVVVASGFRAHDPAAKIYRPPFQAPEADAGPGPARAPAAIWRYPGAGNRADVLTNLQLEQRLRGGGPLRCPSDGEPVRSLAFIQCVGSRDASLGHLWCSKVCCPSALRMARLIQHRRPGTAITVFYIDIQRFGKDFDAVYDRARKDFTFIRAIPSDLTRTDDGRMRLTWFAPGPAQSVEARFDLVVLSVGITPGDDTKQLAAWFGSRPDRDGFFQPLPQTPGVFAAGAASGPMSIAESIADAGQTAWNVLQYLTADTAASPPDRRRASAAREPAGEPS